MAVFLIDAQLPPRLAARFRAAGHEAVHVCDVGLLDADDRTVALEAKQRNAILVSKDGDFLAGPAPGSIQPPLLWIRIGNCTNEFLWQRIEAALPQIIRHFEDGEKVVELV